MSVLPYIEVQSTHIDDNKGTSSKTGRPFHIRRQVAYLFQGEAYPEKFELSLTETQEAYPIGRYLLGGGSFARGQFGLELARRGVTLISAADAASALSRLANSTVKPAAA